MAMAVSAAVATAGEPRADRSRSEAGRPSSDMEPRGFEYSECTDIGSGIRECFDCYTDDNSSYCGPTYISMDRPKDSSP